MKNYQSSGLSIASW